MAEFLILFFTILSGLVVWWSIVHKRTIEPEQRKQVLLSKAKHARKATLELKEEIEKYVDKHNAGDELIQPGVTFNQALEIMDRALEEALSEKNIELLKKSVPNKYQADELDKRIEIHMKHLNESKYNFQVNFRG